MKRFSGSENRDVPLHATGRGELLASGLPFTLVVDGTSVFLTAKLLALH